MPKLYANPIKKGYTFVDLLLAAVQFLMLLLSNKKIAAKIAHSNLHFMRLQISSALLFTKIAKLVYFRSVLNYDTTKSSKFGQSGPIFVQIWPKI